MTECGRVTRVDGNRATVSFLRRGECDKCQLCSVSKDGRSVEITLENTLAVNVGDFVKVELYKKKIRAASVLLYLLPAVLTALGAGLGSLKGIAVAIILAILGAVVGFAFALPIDVCIVRKKDGFKPEMSEVCSETEYLKSNEDLTQNEV